jgi:2-hydroxychromene-2-carboxylate isomerase
MSDDGGQAIEFYFDFSSPYGYLATGFIERTAAEHGRSVLWRPMMLGAAMKETGNRPLKDQPIKWEYAQHDVPRLARWLEMPFVLPEPFPIPTLAAARAFYWLDDRDPALAKRFARACYAAYFGEGRDIRAKEAVADIAASLGVDRDELLAAVDNEAVKQRLKDETQAAVDRGVFGSPYFIVDGEPFWGVDRVWLIAEWLERGGW